MYYEHFNSPIGVIRIVGDDKYVRELSFDTRVDEDRPNEITTKCKGQLISYFDNKRKTFDLPIKLDGTPFQHQVWNILKSIPWGKSESYYDIAKKMGDVNKVRAVGTANGKNPLPIIIPCHRIINKNGNLGGYSGELWRKEYLLKMEVVTASQLSIF